jgi:hypothetical protein
MTEDGEKKPTGPLLRLSNELADVVGTAELQRTQASISMATLLPVCVL